MRADKPTQLTNFVETKVVGDPLLEGTSDNATAIAPTWFGVGDARLRAISDADPGRHESRAGDQWQHRELPRRAPERELRAGLVLRLRGRRHVGDRTEAGRQIHQLHHSDDTGQPSLNSMMRTERTRASGQCSEDEPRSAMDAERRADG